MLKIGGNRFNAAEMAFVLIALTKRVSPSMERIDMAGIGSAVQDSLSSITKDLPKNNHIHVVSLADNALEGPGFAEVVDKVLFSFPGGSCLRSRRKKVRK